MMQQPQQGFFFIFKNNLFTTNQHSLHQQQLTMVGKYLSVLNCLRKEERKKVVKKRMMDQKSTSGMKGPW